MLTRRLPGVREVALQTVLVFAWVVVASVSYLDSNMRSSLIPALLSGTPIRQSSIPADSGFQVPPTRVCLPALTTMLSCT